NLRDYEQDKSVNKKTLIVRYGENFGRSLYSCCIIGSLALIPMFCILELLPKITLITLLAGILTRKILKDVWTKRGKDIIPLLVLTAKYYVLYGTLISLSLILNLFI